MKSLKTFLNWKILVPGLVTALIVGASIGWLVYRHKTLYHFVTVDPGKLYRCGTLSSKGLAWARDITGMKTIVNLRSSDENRKPWHEQEKRFAEANGVLLVDMPLAFEAPPSPEQLRTFLGLIRDPARLPILIHCEMGVVRTGMMVAVYRVEIFGETGEQALKKLDMFGHTLDDKAPAVKEFILNYRRNDNQPIDVAKPEGGKKS